MKYFTAFFLINLLLSAPMFSQIFSAFNGNEKEIKLLISPDAEDIKSLLNKSDDNLQKLSSDLLQLYDAKYLPSGTSISEHIKTLNNAKIFMPDPLESNEIARLKTGKVYVYIFFNEANEIYSADNYILTVTDRDEKNNMLAAWVQVDKLPLIAALTSVRSIRSVLSPILRTGSVITEGDAVHRTSNVRTTFGNEGAGVKVGVISDGVQTRSSSQSTGDLPNDGNGLTVLSAGSGDEGTAMLEIIHDMVPSADLFFHTAGSNTTQFNTAIDNLVAAGCKIICDDIGWITQPFFEDGTIASHLQSVLAANDILYVSSAGNAGYSHYQGMYYPISGSNTQHHFGEGSTSQGYYLFIHLPASTNVRIVLQWDDLFGASSNDYDLYLYRYSNNSYTQVAKSYNTQNGNDDPLEFINYTSPVNSNYDYAIIVNKYSGAAKNLEVFIYPSGNGYVYSNNIKPQDAIFGHPAVNGVISVGAVDQATPTVIEPFSSQGPSTISYPFAEVRQKPEIVGTDFVSVTGAGGFPSTFGGTSAAAPHIVGILAQAWSYNLNQTADQVRQLLFDWAVDLGSTGFDNVFGYGRGDAFNIFEGALPVELTSFSASLAGSDIKLHWRTETESLNYGFEVQRKVKNTSSESNFFKTIGFVGGSGTTNSPKEYSYIDKDIKHEIYCYRLRQIDTDGSFSFSKEIEISPAFLNNYVLNQNYPNPFNPSTSIEFNLLEPAHVKLTVFNPLGEQVKILVDEHKESGLHIINFSLRDFESGVYVYKMEAGSFSQCKKMLLIK